MRTIQLWLKQITKLGLILMMGVSMSACSKSWKEEVQLHDGRKIIVERVQNLGNRPTWESRERAILDETITFSLPEARQRIVWSMSFRDDVPEQNGVNVMLLDIVNNAPYIAGYPAGCIAYNKWKRPNPPQILFKFEGDKWRRIALAEFPPHLTQANVIVGGPPAEGIRLFYTTEQVNEENHDIDTPEYKTILREAIQSWEGCPELIRIEGGWVSPGGGKSPIPIGPRKPSDVKK